MKAIARFFFRYKYATVLVLFGGIPLFALAQSTGLVPCGFSVSNLDFLNATSCNFCYLTKLIQAVVNFLVMVTIPISIAMFAWAGIMFFTSAGNPKRVARAKSIFSSVFIGFIVTISGWLIVQIVLQSITNSDFYNLNNWASLDCSQSNQNRPRNEDLGSLIGSNSLTPGTGTTGGTPTTPGTGGTTPDPTNPGGGSVTPGTYVDSEARTQLQLAGISVNKLDCPNASATDCTSLGGIQTTTITQIINLKEACQCGFVVTGGTEAGHSAGDNSHTAGYKMDISLGSVDSYIQSTMTSIGTRAGDNAPQWKDPYGNVYAKEGNHWDIQIRAAGPLQTRPSS